MGQLIEKISIQELSDCQIDELSLLRKFKIAIIGVPCDEGESGTLQSYFTVDHESRC